MSHDVSLRNAILYLKHLEKKYNNINVYSYPGDEYIFIKDYDIDLTPFYNENRRNVDYFVIIAPINDYEYGFILIDHVNKRIEQISHQDIPQKFIITKLHNYDEYIVSLYREPKILISLLFIETRLINQDAPMETSIDIVENISTTYLQAYLTNILSLSGQPLPIISGKNLNPIQVKLPPHIENLTPYQARQFIPSRPEGRRQRAPGIIPSQPLEIIPGRLQGIIMCHGHAQGSANIPNWIPNNVQWTFVDINEATRPDVVAGFDDPESLSQLGYGKWDYIIPKLCPYNTRNSNLGILTFIQNVTPLLNYGGRLILDKVLSDIMKHSLVLNRRPSSKEIMVELKRCNDEQCPELESEIIKFVHQAGFSTYQIYDTKLILIRDF